MVKKGTLENLAGRRVRCLWPAEGEWFEGVLLASACGKPGAYTVLYDDGDKEDLVLPDESVELINEEPLDSKSKQPKKKAEAKLSLKSKNAKQSEVGVSKSTPVKTAQEASTADKSKSNKKGTTSLNSPAKVDKTSKVASKPLKENVEDNKAIVEKAKRKASEPTSKTESKKQKTANHIQLGSNSDLNGPVPMEEVLGESKEVVLPLAMDVLLRHCKECQCDACKRGISRGRSKTKTKPKAKAPGALGLENKKRMKAASSRLRSHFTCSLCNHHLESPVSTPCNHTFCRDCLAKHLGLPLQDGLKSDSSEFRVRGGTGENAGGRSLRAVRNNRKCPACPGSLSSFLEACEGALPLDEGVQRQVQELKDSVAAEESELQKLEATRKQLELQPTVPVEEDEEEQEGMEVEGSETAEPTEAEDPNAILEGVKKLGEDWKNKVLRETRVVGTITIPPPTFGFTPDQVVVPNDWVVVHEESSVEEQRAVRAVSQAIREFMQIRDQAILDEDKRVQESGGVREDGKRMSKRSDLKANTQMQQAGKHLHGAPVIGALPGVPVGTQFSSRAECVVVGLHSHWLNGIDTTKTPKAPGKQQATVATAVVMSGGYEDDIDGGATIIYTGEGGNDMLHTRRQIADQEYKRGNLALVNNCHLQLPIRVIRGNVDPASYTKMCFIYDGLYMVKSYWWQVGVSGYQVCKFHLARLPGQRQLDSASVHWGNNMGTSLPRTLRAQDRPGLVLADISLGQERLPIPVVNTFDRSSPHWAPTPIPLRPTKDKQGRCSVQGVKWPKDESGKNVTHAFIYTPSPIYGEGVPQPRPAPELTSKTLSDLNGGFLPYVSNQRLHAITELVVYESPPLVSTRSGGVTGQDACQSGIKYRLEIFRTEGKGWGVRSWDRIPAGAFVCEFTGEVLTEASAEGRGAHEQCEDYEGEGEFDEYMFELALNGMSLHELLTGDKIDHTHHGREKVHESRQRDPAADAKAARKLLKTGQLSEEDARVSFHLDGKSAGSVARFINHSDDPNLSIAMVLHDHHDPRLAHLCLFAHHNIPPLTELTYDYGEDYRTKLLSDNYTNTLARGSR